MDPFQPNVGFEDCRQAMLPKKMTGDRSEDPELLPFTLPTNHQKLSRDVVFSLPCLEAGKKVVPDTLTYFQLLLEAASVLPNELHEKLSDVFRYVLCKYSPCLRSQRFFALQINKRVAINRV
jgi:hypothetical protein